MNVIIYGRSLILKGIFSKNVGFHPLYVLRSRSYQTYQTATVEPRLSEHPEANVMGITVDRLLLRSLATCSIISSPINQADRQARKRARARGLPRAVWPHTEYRLLLLHSTLWHQRVGNRNIRCSIIHYGTIHSRKALRHDCFTLFVMDDRSESPMYLIICNFIEGNGKEQVR